MAAQESGVLGEISPWIAELAQDKVKQTTVVSQLQRQLHHWDKIDIKAKKAKQQAEKA